VCQVELLTLKGSLNINFNIFRRLTVRSRCRRFGEVPGREDLLAYSPYSEVSLAANKSPPHLYLLLIGLHIRQRRTPTKAFTNCDFKRHKGTTKTQLPHRP
jgi:hypothetical protein